MKRILTCLLFPVLLTVCKKQATATPNAGADRGSVSSTTQATPPPPEVAEAARLYFLGMYADAAKLIQPKYDELKAKDEARNSGLAGGWLALALARDVVENAKAPAEHAVAMSAKTGDTQLRAVAKLAMGAYQLGVDEFDAASASFDEAAKLAPDGWEAALAHLLRAETSLGRAFGGGDNTEIQNPAQLDKAKSDYQAAKTIASKLASATIVQARAAEGLAAVAKYKHDKAGLCSFADEAAKLYEQSGASDYLKQGPRELIDSAQCP